MALLAVAEALERVLDGVGPLGVEWVSVGAAHARVLAEDLRPGGRNPRRRFRRWMAMPFGSATLPTCPLS